MMATIAIAGSLVQAAEEAALRVVGGQPPQRSTPTLAEPIGGHQASAPIGHDTPKYDPPTRYKPYAPDVGAVTVGFDPICGVIEPGISLGNGLNIGIDGHIHF